MDNNKFIIVNVHGEEREIDDPKIIIKAKGKNNIFKIYEPYFIQNKLYITMQSSSNIEIKKDLKVYDKLIINTTSNQSVYIDESFHCSSVTMYNWCEPYLSIKIGKNCLFSSDIVIRTSDGHTIFDLSEPNIAINSPQYGVKIGDHVWIGYGANILKDVTIEHDCMVATKSVVCSGIYKHNCIIGGVPAKIIREYINWSTDNTFNYNKKTKNLS